MADVMEIEILEDGTVRSTTGKISLANHGAADQFFAVMFRLMGGSVRRIVRGLVGAHEHEHDGVRHSH
jgi:hypothetical protein